MIEGLKVTIAVDELRALCEKQAQFHDARAQKYAENVKNLEDTEVEGMTYSGGDPQKTLRDKCTQHQNARAQKYAENVKNLEDTEVEGMTYSGGDPQKTLRDKCTQHQNAATELRFIGAHLQAGESYLLDSSALMKLGILRNPHGFLF